MAEATVNVRGLKELQRDLRKANGEVAKQVRDELRAAAEPVRAQAQTLFSGVDERSASGYRVAVRARGVAVEQKLRRSTGLRPDFGQLQMRRALIPALEAKTADVEKGLLDMLDRLID